MEPLEPTQKYEHDAESSSLMKRVLSAAFDRPSQIPDGFLAYILEYIKTTGLDVPLRWLRGYPSDGTKFAAGDGTWKVPPGGGSGGYATVQDEGTPLAQRSTLDFAGAGVTATDDAGNSRTLVTIPGGSGYATVQDEGTPLTQQTTLDFVGAGVTASNDVGVNNRTLVTIPGGGAPTGAAGGDLAGTYPNPTVALLAVTDGKVAAANKDGAAATPSMRTLGTGAAQAAAGNDSRLSDSRAPSGTASGDLAGTYPSPTVALLAITDAKVAAANKDGAVGVASMRTLGTGAQQAAAGNDSRLSDSRNSKGNGSASAQVASGVDTYVTGSDIPISGVVKAGTVIKWRISVTKTGAGIVAPILVVRTGTARSTADAARNTFNTFTAQTAVADSGFIDIEIVFQSVGASGVAVGAVMFTHAAGTTGFATQSVQVFTLTSAAFDTTVASTFAGISINPGTSGAWTFKTVSAQLINPA